MTSPWSALVALVVLAEPAGSALAGSDETTYYRYEVWGASTREPGRERPWSKSYDTKGQAEARLREIQRDHAKGGLLESDPDHPRGLYVKKVPYSRSSAPRDRAEPPRTSGHPDGAVNRPRPTPGGGRPTADEEDNQRLLRERRALEQEEARLLQVDRRLKEEAARVKAEKEALLQRAIELVAQRNTLNARRFRCPNGEPPERCSHSDLKRRFESDRQFDSQELNEAVRKAKARTNLLYERENTLRDQVSRYNSDLQALRARSSRYNAVLSRQTNTNGR